MVQLAVILTRSASSSWRTLAVERKNRSFDAVTLDRTG
jgi:hypothetical protein